MSKKIIARLENNLAHRKEANNFRALSVSSGLVDFCSNDYLGLSRSVELKHEIEGRIKELECKAGATGSRLISGNSAIAEQVEAELARFFKAERSLIFNSGYTANVGLLSSIPQRGDLVLYDELSHASIKDGIRLSMADKQMFRHNDLDDLERKLRKECQGSKFIVAESIYSMDGDECPLDKLVALAGQYEAAVILDEAHSTGILGGYGQGMAIALGVEDKLFARIYTFGKAMGVHGACVAGGQVLIDYLVNYARSFIYTTALPEHSIISISSSFKVLKKHPYWIADLQDLVGYFIKGFNTCFDGMIARTLSNSAIQSILIPGNNEVKKVANQLNNAGFDVRPIVSPTVQEGKERLRICLHRYNTTQQIDGLLKIIKEAIQ